MEKRQTLGYEVTAMIEGGCKARESVITSPPHPTPTSFIFMNLFHFLLADCTLNSNHSKLFHDLFICWDLLARQPFFRLQLWCQVMVKLNCSWSWFYFMYYVTVKIKMQDQKQNFLISVCTTLYIILTIANLLGEWITYIRDWFFLLPLLHRVYGGGRRQKGLNDKNVCNDPPSNAWKWQLGPLF